MLQISKKPHKQKVLTFIASHLLCHSKDSTSATCSFSNPLLLLGT